MLYNVAYFQFYRFIKNKINNVYQSVVFCIINRLYITIFWIILFFWHFLARGSCYFQKNNLFLEIELCRIFAVFKKIIDYKQILRSFCCFKKKKQSIL